MLSYIFGAGPPHTRSIREEVDSDRGRSRGCDHDGVRADAHAELKVGDPAPDFTLKATDGKTCKLSDFRGKKAVVVAWFPKAFTQGCTIECKSLAENGRLIEKYDVTYFMASVDPLEENTKFGAEYNADFPLLSDPDKSVATAYGVLNQSARAVARHQIDGPLPLLAEQRHDVSRT